MAFIDTVIIINYLFIETNKNTWVLGLEFKHQYQNIQM